MLMSADGTTYHIRPDFVGIDEAAVGESVVPIRAAAARGMWSVVRKLRQAGCSYKDHEHCGNVCFGRSVLHGRTVWHDLATPEVEDWRGGAADDDLEEQMAWAK